MKKFLTVFKFEFANYMKNKAYVGITLFLVVAIAVVLSGPRILELISPEEEAAQELDKPIIAVSGLANEGELAYFGESMPDNEFLLVDEDITSIKALVEQGDYQSAIVIDGDLSYKYIVRNVVLYDNMKYIVDEVLKIKYQTENLMALGAGEQEIATILNPVINSEVVQINSGKDQTQTFFYTYILIFALYMAILLYGQFVAMGVATEKSSRAMELLITSAKPTQLMFGKIFGIGMVGLLQFVLIFGSGYLFYNMNSQYYQDNIIVQSIFNMPLEILLYAVAFFVLGFFLYASMYGALGSVVSRVEQINTSVLPVTFMFIIAFMLVMFSMGSGEVDTILMKVLSYIPFTSPMAMFVRITMGQVELYEIIISIVLLVVSVIGVAYLAALIYKMGVLMYGQPPKIKEVFSMLKKSNK